MTVAVPTAVLLLYFTVYSLDGITVEPSLTTTSGSFAALSYSKLSGESLIPGSATSFGLMVTSTPTAGLSL